jgi:hypothetical protein
MRGRRRFLRWVAASCVLLAAGALGACGGDGESFFEDYSFPRSQAREGNPQRYISDEEQARLRQEWLEEQEAKKAATPSAPDG